MYNRNVILKYSVVKFTTIIFSNKENINHVMRVS